MQATKEVILQQEDTLTAGHHPRCTPSEAARAVSPDKQPLHSALRLSTVSSPPLLTYTLKHKHEHNHPSIPLNIIATLPPTPAFPPA